MRKKPESHLVELAEAIRLSAPAIETFADELPRDPKEVERLLQECIDGYFGRAFTVVSLAALHVGIPVEARFLIEGARLLPNPAYVATLSGHMTGDVTGALLSAVADGRLSREKEAVAIFLASRRCLEEGGERHRREIVRSARMQARRANGLAQHLFILGAAEILGDPELSFLAPSPERLRPLSDEMTDALIELGRRPVLWNLEEDEDAVAILAPRRRAVVRLGRNDACHCGSGKKYKRCCAEKDEDRLRDSSDVAGLTRAELRRHLEEHLTLERIHSLKAYELAGLDPTLIAPDLRRAVLNRLAVFREFGAIRELFAAIGTDGLEGHWLDAIDFALDAGKKDEARALMAIGNGRKDEWLGFPARFLAEGIEEVRALEILEDEAKRSIDEGPVGLAIDPWPMAHLGIHVARGVAPPSPPLDLDTLLEELGLARDCLDLPASIPSRLRGSVGWGEELEDLEPETAVEPEPQRQLEDRHARDLAVKEAEVARLREELSRLRKKLEAEQNALSEAKEPPKLDGRDAELKERVAALKTELSQRHSERNQLRRQLDRTMKRLEALEAERRDRESPGDPGDDVDVTDELVEIPLGPLPLRIPIFSKRFRSSLEKAPEPTRRRAVVVASRIAAGDASALRGACRLRSDRDLYRQRIGREYRLLFRLQDEELDVVELAPRRELSAIEIFRRKLRGETQAPIGRP
jgi:mRNA-degrading endonuclease RelE of RelBE toxin-antitoxin system